MLCQRARVEAAFGAVQRGVGPTAQRRRGHLSRAELDDWRSFRAALVFDQTSWKRGDPNAANLDLLRRQSPALAAEETWCHPTGLAEVGGLLLATPRCQDILQDEKLWQIVVLIVSLGEQGAVGLTLNRPTDLNMGVRTRGAFPMDVGGLSNQHRAHLGACRIYSGGPTAQQRLQVLHRHGWLEGAVELVRGIYTGGAPAAAEAIAAGKASPADFRFFAGVLAWPSDRLGSEIAAGAWVTAACSRNIVLRQYIDLPTPLWEELRCMAGATDVPE